MKKGFILVLVIVVLGIGVYYFVPNQGDYIISNQDSGEQNLQTYISQEHGLSFEYPDSYSLVNTADSTSAFDIQLYMKPVNTGATDEYIYVSRDDDWFGGIDSIETLINDLHLNRNLENRSDFTINNYEIVKGEKTSFDEETTTYVVTFFEGEGVVIQFGPYFHNKNEFIDDFVANFELLEL